MNRPSGNTAAPATQGGMGSWKRVLIVALLALIVAVPFSFAIVAQFGVVAGEEFSPSRFRRRSYHYFEIPFIHYQITPLEQQDRTNDLELHLAQNKLIRPVTNAKAQWDLVTLSRGDLDGPPGDATILCRYLDLKDEEGNHLWLTWTKDHPAVAKIFWPAVAEAAQRGMYILVPDLFHLAEQAEDATELQKQLARRLSRQYERLGRVQQQLGRHEGAAELFSAALQYDPQFTKARQGRDEALQAAGKSPAKPTQPQS